MYVKPNIFSRTEGWGARHTIITLTSTGSILISMARYCLSITIVSMVARPQHAHIPTHDPAHVPAHALESSGNGACPVPGNGSEKATWNETMSVSLVGIFECTKISVYFYSPFILFIYLSEW